MMFNVGTYVTVFCPQAQDLVDLYEGVGAARVVCVGEARHAELVLLNVIRRLTVPIFAFSSLFGK